MFAAIAHTEKRVKYALCMLALLGVISLCAFLSGCVNQYPEESEGEGGTRIVATSPAVVEICDKLELDLVGVPETASTLPLRYDGVQTVGSAMSPDLEILSSLHPDYVISPNTLEEDLQPKYEGAGLASIFVDLKSVDGLYDSIEYLGNKFGREEQAQALVDEYESYLAEFQSQNDGKEAPRVLILMGVPGSYVVATENSYVGSLVKLAGGQNVYADEEADFVNANTEDMLSRDPDIILRTAHALPDQVMEMFAEEFEINDIWKHFRAVQDGCVYDLNNELFGMSATFDYPQALDELQSLLYGETSSNSASDNSHEATSSSSNSTTSVATNQTEGGQ